MQFTLVKVYYNLRRKCLSVVATEGCNKGKVVDYVNTITLEEVIFRVSEAGRQRVLKTKQRNVHAYVIGKLCSSVLLTNIQVTYNPFRHSTFVTVDTFIPVLQAPYCKIIDNKIYI